MADKRQKLGLPAQLLQAGTAACIADLITFPLDTTKVFELDQKHLGWTLLDSVYQVRLQVSVEGAAVGRNGGFFSNLAKVRFLYHLDHLSK